MKVHSKLSASSSHRWLHCPGSIKAEEGIPSARSFFSDEGSAAHELMEICLLTGTSAFERLGDQLVEFKEFVVTQEMAENVQQYIDYVALYNSDDVEMYVEKRLDYSQWAPDGFGTADTIVYNNTRSVVDVFDLKYGMNRVYAHGNTQGLLYMLGAIEDELIEIDTFRFHIVQPRLDHIDTYTLSRSELLELGGWVRKRSALALSDNADRVPGDMQCKYCKAKATCPALKKAVEDVLMTDFDSLETVNPDRLTEAQLQKAMGARKLIVSWLDAVEDHIVDKIYKENIDTYAGYKLVTGRSLRQWRDEVQAEAALVEMLGGDAYERKVLSVAKAEKILGKRRAGDISKLIEKPLGKPTLVPQDDPRPVYGKESPSDFDSFE